MKKVKFSVGELEIIEALREVFDITHMEACEKVICQKREAAYAYSMAGQFDLAEQLLTDLDEWNDEIAKEFVNRGRGKTPSTKIVIPGD